jgi:hypothetical protein
MVVGSAVLQVFQGTRINDSRFLGKKWFVNCGHDISEGASPLDTHAHSKRSFRKTLLKSPHQGYHWTYSYTRCDVPPQKFHTDNGRLLCSISSPIGAVRRSDHTASSEQIVDNECWRCERRRPESNLRNNNKKKKKRETHGFKDVFMDIFNCHRSEWSPEEWYSNIPGLLVRKRTTPTDRTWQPAKLVPTSAGKGCPVVSTTDSHGR